ncbi:MAG TPA: L,D-transpeptidase [Methylibium sp.]|uniref:L,D-transpeptidase n=1 Tax=Methylibium sp. TaxID=2067992 RepID=UPI002DBB4412|nr:L,D-transpeptidase [Methylibium sp.]HEU4459131.1 L,D-transpeptidase [Methylibium sp.]
MSRTPRAALACLLASLALPSLADPPHARQAARDAALMARASSTVRLVVAEVLRTHDQRGRPFAILDKTAAALYVFEPGGRMAAATPVLLGLAKGDDSVPGIGERPLEQVRPSERTTPAGRFELEAGINTRGDRIFWVDYDAAVSMHPLRAIDASERRHQRIATRSAADNRISFGCINVPTAFFDRVITASFGRGASARDRGAFYVLPETRTLAEVFPRFAVPATLASRASP